MLHHQRDYLAAAQADRRARASRRRRLSADAAELEAMLHAASRGDAQSWTALVERFAPRVRRTARLRQLSSQDVDDVVQTTWLTLMEHVGSVRDPEALGAWLDTTARRESLRVLRKATRERPTDEPLGQHEHEEPLGDRRLIEAERRAALAAGIDRLAPVQQRLIRMLLAQPTSSYSEISRALGTPVGSIGPTRQRSLERLRRDPELRRVVGQEG